ncbi:MAG: lycopene beta-cyclase CrtY [Bdellovibrionaceae bacterium]|nr:lycopene beta-cyclase CrtY [Bdellovibrio sp.]
MKSTITYNVSIAGGGLAGCLLLVAIKNRWPQVVVQLHERTENLCGEHTWSFHHDDVPISLWPWLRPLITCTWPSYEVFFPLYRRKFNSAYYSIKSKDLAKKVLRDYASSVILNSNFNADEADFVTTGWPPRKKQSNYGYQKFVGLEVTTEAPHGLKSPILKDARQPQTDGYRFFYVLPWSERELLIEDTYYSNSSALDIDQIKSEIEKYAQQMNWKISQIRHVEKGSLPLDMYKMKNKNNVNGLGAAAGLAHPVTGYTLPLILQQIEAILKPTTIDLKTSKNNLAHINQRLEKNFSFYRFLNRMMFNAALPEKRYIILERFYTLSEGLIQRFYAGKTTGFDRVRILVGKPPVPIAKAVQQFKDSV